MSTSRTKPEKPENMTTYLFPPAVYNRIDNPPSFVTIHQHPEDRDHPDDKKDKTNSNVTPSPPPSSTVSTTVDAAAAASVSTTSEDPSSVGAAAEVVGPSDMKSSSGSSDDPHYKGPQVTVVHMSSEFYSKLILWSMTVLRRFTIDFIDFRDEEGPIGPFPSRFRKWEVLVALSFVSGKNVLFWINELYRGEISRHIVEFFDSLREQS